MFGNCVSGTKLSLLGLVAAAAVTATSPAVSATKVVYSQPGNGAACSPACWTSSVGLDSLVGFAAFDNFTLSHSEQIVSMQWQGFFYDFIQTANNPVTPPAATWHIAFLGDAGGMPDLNAVLYDQVVTVASTFMGFGSFNQTVPVYSFTAQLPVLFNASANTQYWVAPVALPATFNPFFSWSGSSVQPSGAFTAQTFINAGVPGAFSQRFGDRAFTLSAVPEPSTWAMMIVGLAGLGLAGARRARRTAVAAG